MYEDIANRQQPQATTWCDRAVMHVTYGSMIVATRFIWPEASMNLAHVVYGNGSRLELPSDYFRRSAVIRRAIRRAPTGISGPYTLRQSEDQRLSYTYNPFHLEIRQVQGGRRIRIFEYMVFAKDKRVRTTFVLGRFKFRMSDGLVYVISPCKPFIAEATWTE